MAKKNKSGKKAFTGVQFPQQYIWNCWNTDNEQDEQDTHMAISMFLDGIERGLSNSDANVYGTIYYAIQAIEMELTVDNLDNLKKCIPGAPFNDNLDRILEHGEEFIETIERLESEDLTALLVKALYCHNENPAIKAANYSNFGPNDYRRSMFFAQVALMVLENRKAIATSYADFGGGYGDFAMMVAASGLPCSVVCSCEKDANAVKVAGARLAITKCRAAVDMGDIFDLEWDPQFDRIFSEPSFSDDFDSIPDEYISAVKERYGYEVSASDHDWLYALCASEHLTERGKAMVVVRQGSLSDPATENARRIILEQNLLAGVVNLPDYFKIHGEKMACVILRKGSESVSMHGAEEVDSRGEKGRMDGYMSQNLIEVLRSI